jgi:hypothetical protein
MIGRQIPKADMAQWLECVAMDGGLRPQPSDISHQTSIQVVLLHKQQQMKNFNPDIFAELDGKAFTGPIGEFLISCVKVEDLTTMDDLFVDSMQVIANAAEMKRLIVVPNAEQIYDKVREAVGDLHHTIEHWPERIFVSHLDVLRRDESVNQFLYAKYCKAFLGEKDFAEADQDKLKSEYDRLVGWFKDMEWSEMKNPRNLEPMGLKVNYLGLSRRELYELYSVLLLIERIEPFLPDTRADEVIDKLKPIFYNERTEALKFYKDIKGMKPTQITDKVNQLVSDKKISDMSKHRDLWKVLHDCGIYDKSESNWNQQVK